MDPVRNLCIVKDSFQEKFLNKIPKYSENVIGSPRSRRKHLLENKTEKQVITDDVFIPTQVANPFLEASGFFQKQSSWILANVDVLFNFSKQEDGYILPQVITRDYTYALLDADKGFLEYLEYRLPAATGFTDCINTKDNKIATQFLNQNRGKDLVDYVLNIQAEGVDLVVSNSPLSEKTLLQALKMGHVGATFITKISTETPIEYLYALSMWFKSVALVKPFLEDLNSNIGYFVCEDFTGDALDAMDLDFLQINVPNNFYEYVQNYYNSIKLLKTSLPKDTKYNMYKCKAILKGVPRERPYKMRTMAKTKKRPERPYGGVLCSKCMREIFKEKARINK